MKNFYLLIFCVLLNSLWCQMDGGTNCRDCNLNDCGNPGCEYEIVISKFIMFCSFVESLNGCNGQVGFDIENYDCMGVNEKINTKTNTVCSLFSNRERLCVLNNTKCEYKKCEELSENCNRLNYCIFFESEKSCKVNDCRGFITEDDCKNITLEDKSELICKWENNKCIEIPKCGGNENNISECSNYITSGDDYICYSDGEKCREANSCESVQVTNISIEELANLCSKFPHCQPGKNNTCIINKCDNIINQEECKYAHKEEEEIFIKCKWVSNASDGKKCQVDGDNEIKTCNDAIKEINMTNDQCSKLNVEEGKYCRKGPDGCFEFGDCDNIDDIEIEFDICKELNKPDDSKCIPSDKGCKIQKVKCSEKNLYIYDKIICEKLDISLEGYKCLSNGKECIEVNSCDSINDTSYETNSTELKKLCDLFDNCEPYENRCKTKYIPTTIVTTIPIIVTTLPTTTLLTTILTNIPSIISTTIISILTTEPSTIVNTVSTTIQTKESNTILTTKPTTKSTTEFDKTQITSLRTIPIISSTTTLTIPSTTPNTTPTTTNTTTSTATLTTIPSTIPNLINNTITINIPTNIPYINTTTIPILTHTTITNIPTNITTTITTNIPTSITTNINNTNTTNIPTNIPYTNTTNITTTIPNLITTNIPTNIPYTNTTTIPILTHTTITTNIPTNIPYFNTTNIPTTIPNFIHTTISQTIPTTIHTIIPRIIPSTIANTELIIPSETFVKDSPNYEPIPVIILGLNHFQMNPSYYSFFIHFTPITNTIYSQIINFKGIIDYYTNIRVLKETEGNCTLQNANKLKYRYYCIDYEDTENIKSIKILPDFKFVNQDIDIIGVSFIAKKFMDNLLIYDVRYDLLNNSTIYLMDNSTYETNGKLSFNITGRINGTQPKFENKDINLMVSLQSGQKTEANLDCVINNIYLEYYQLNCKSNESLIINLQGAISFIDNDDLLIFNFIDGNNTIIELKDIKSDNKLFLSKHTALNPGAIAAIIIPLVVVVAVVIFLAFFIRKKEKVWKENISNSSSIINLKN